jgi:hypothetical protein
MRTSWLALWTLGMGSHSHFPAGISPLYMPQPSRELKMIRINIIENDKNTENDKNKLFLI